VRNISETKLGKLDGVARFALQKAGNTHVTETHLTTDHAYSGQRIALTTAVLNWLSNSWPCFVRIVR
jgi:hypothetical protein